MAIWLQKKKVKNIAILNYEIFRPSSGNTHIPNKKVVKYLGIHLDTFLYFNDHINIQLIKARNAFFKYKA